MTSRIPETFPAPITPRKGLAENAVCVFKGVIFEVWQWEQKMFDGTTEIFERAYRIPSALIVAVVGEKIMIERQSQPNHHNYLSLPSGMVESGESILEGAKRELREETGYESQEWSELLSFQSGAKVLHDVQYFVARNCQKVASPTLDGGEQIEVEFVDFDHFLKLYEDEQFMTYPEFLRVLFLADTRPDKREELRRAMFGDQPQT